MSDKTSLRIGQWLKERRSTARISLAQAENETKIRQAQLKNIESGKYDLAINRGVYENGLLQSYAKYLAVESELIQRLERPLKRSASHKAIWLKRSQIFSIVSTQVASRIALAVSIMATFVYFGWQLAAFNSAPRLDIHAPSSDVLVKNPSIVIAGSTEAETQVFINNQLLDIAPNGDFQIEMGLAPGKNQFDILAVNNKKRSAQIRRYVVYEVVEQIQGDKSPRQ